MNHFSLNFNTYHRIRWIEYILLFIALFIAFYWGMSTYAIANTNEGLYAEIPQEMLKLRNYIIPQLNYVPYIEKPPLFYWLIALSYKILGISEYSARLIPALSATFICLSMVYFGNRIRINRQGWLAAVILTSSIGFIIIGRVLIFDMLLTLFFTLSLIFFYLWYKNNTKKHLRLFYLFVGLALLTKGFLVALLIPIIAFSFYVVSPKSSKKMLAFVDPLGLILLVMLVLPWHYLAIKQQPGFAWDYFINEQIFRVLNKRLPHDYHTGPFYFYFPKLFMYLFPWSLLSFLFFKRNKNMDRTLHTFLWLWVIVPLLFFSISKAKGDYYMIISTPALALLLALRLNELFLPPFKKTLIYFFLTVGIFEIVAFGILYCSTKEMFFIAYFPQFCKLDPDFETPLKYLLISASSITMAGFSACIHYQKKPLIPLSCLLSLIALIVIFFVINKQKIEYRQSESNLARYILKHDLNRKVYLYKDFERLSSVLFYLQRRVILIESHSKDLDYGMHSKTAEGWFLSFDNFLHVSKDQVQYVIMRKDSLSEFMHAIAPQEYYILEESGNSVIVSNIVP